VRWPVWSRPHNAARGLPAGYPAPAARNAFAFPDYMLVTAHQRIIHTYPAAARSSLISCSACDASSAPCLLPRRLTPSSLADPVQGGRLGIKKVAEISTFLRKSPMASGTGSAVAAFLGAGFRSVHSRDRRPLAALWPAWISICPRAEQRKHPLYLIPRSQAADPIPDSSGHEQHCGFRRSAIHVTLDGSFIVQPSRGSSRRRSVHRLLLQPVSE
jgi:hypothetical protein